MIKVFPCRDHIEELVQFVARLNSDGAHHIGFFGEGEADVRASLAECIIPPADGFMMAYDDAELVGIFGVDADPEVNRAWLLGPLVDHANWHAIADQLYESILLVIPENIRDRDMFCDVQNVHIGEFAARHGFPLHSENAFMTLVRSRYTPTAKRMSQVVSYRESFFSPFEKLHNTLFPNTYFTARQIIEKQDMNHQLFLAVKDEQLFGYHFCKIEPESESGYVDFIGTDSSARGRGIAPDLLASGVDWMLSAVSTKKINLTVNANNIPARNLYEKFGFVTERVMCGYRKQVTG